MPSQLTIEYLDTTSSNFFIETWKRGTLVVDQEQVKVVDARGGLIFQEDLSRIEALKLRYISFGESLSWKVISRGITLFSVRPPKRRVRLFSQLNELAEIASLIDVHTRRKVADTSKLLMVRVLTICAYLVLGAIVVMALLSMM